MEEDPEYNYTNNKLTVKEKTSSLPYNDSTATLTTKLNVYTCICTYMYHREWDQIQFGKAKPAHTTANNFYTPSAKLVGV